MDLDKLNEAFEGSECCYYYHVCSKKVGKFLLGKDHNSRFITITDAITQLKITKIIPTQKAIDYLKSLKS